MSEHNPIIEWWIRLNGHKFDLSDAARFVKNETICKVELDDDGEYYLKSESLNGFGDGWEVLARGEYLTAQINGALKALLPDFRPIRATNVVPIHENGGHGVVILPHTAKIEIRGGRLTVTVSGEEPKDESAEITRWLEISEQESDVADALHYLSREPDWFDLYKGYEVIRKDLGGKDQLVNSLGADATDKADLRDEVTLFASTAQDFRHSRRTGSSPPNPMTLDDAHALMKDLSARYLRHKGNQRV